MKLQRLLSLTRQAIDTYDMIEEGDKIAVGISGGKDSLTLLYALQMLSRFYPKHFEVYAVTVDLGFENLDLTQIKAFCEKLQVPYTIIKTQIAEIVFQTRREANPCSLCAKMRKGALNDEMKRLERVICTVVEQLIRWLMHIIRMMSLTQCCFLSCLKENLHHSYQKHIWIVYS